MLTINYRALWTIFIKKITNLYLSWCSVRSTISCPISSVAATLVLSKMKLTCARAENSNKGWFAAERPRHADGSILMTNKGQQWLITIGYSYIITNKNINLLFPKKIGLIMVSNGWYPQKNNMYQLFIWRAGSMLRSYPKNGEMMRDEHP